MNEPTLEQIQAVEVSFRKWTRAQRERLHTRLRSENLPLSSATQATIDQATVNAAAASGAARVATEELADALRNAGVIS